jgi:hypothetical protein
MRHFALRSPLRSVPLLSAALVLASALPAAAENSRPVAAAAFESAALTEAARALPKDGRLTISAVPLSIDGKDRLADLTLQRFEVFSPKARIVLHSESGDQLLPIPRNIYLRGRIAGDPRSRVVISVLETGEVRGLANSLGRYWLIGAATGETLLRSREVGPLETFREGGEFTCGLEQLGAEAFRAGDPAEADALASFLDRGPLAGMAGRDEEVLGTFDHTAVIAIETDTEFLDLPAIGNNPTTGANYIADMTAFASSVYIDEVQTSWELGEVSLWQGADVYSQQAACGLLEFGRVWNLPPNSLFPRTTAHFLSGKASNSGIAWVGVLCSTAFTTSPANLGTTCAAPVSGSGLYGGAYGFTGGIDANFNVDNPNVVWDIVAYTHEIGHNFNSPHTHCYQNLNGNAASIDNCNAGQCGTTGCYCGATSLPSGCPGAGQGCGTLMSYCHLLGGNLGNLTLTLGEGHPFGVQPGRVPTRMRDHVEARAAVNPLCLQPQSGSSLIFEDGFESGNIANWN